jgi:hypothetical protein
VLQALAEDAAEACADSPPRALLVVNDPAFEGLAGVHALRLPARG